VQAASFLALGVGILLYLRPAFDAALERTWVALAAVVLGGAGAFQFMGTPPSPYADDVFWPRLWRSPATASTIRAANEVAYLFLAISFVALLVKRRTHLRGLDRRSGHPVLVSGAIMALGSALVQIRQERTGATLVTLMDVKCGQAVFAVGLPLVLVASALRARWAEQTVATRLVGLVQESSHGAVEDGLRIVLQDDTLRVWLWDPGQRRYLDRDGRVLADVPTVTADDQNGGRIHAVMSAEGRPLAVCGLTAGLTGHENLAEAALRAVGRVLQAAQLELINLEQVRGIQNRLLAAEHGARRAMARDLHDGVQQELAALKLDLRRVLRLPALPAREQALECIERVDSITAKVRQIARGVQPLSLTERGLAAALEEDVEGLGRRVVLDIPPDRLPPDVEITLYYCLKEGLTNAERYAQASTIAVRVRIGPDEVVGEVVDDGVGGAKPTLGGGLRGVEDRARAARGRLALVSVPGAGTTQTVTLPLGNAHA
jgi:signal transduction histidine kinase